MTITWKGLLLYALVFIIGALLYVQALSHSEDWEGTGDVSALQISRVIV